MVGMLRSNFKVRALRFAADAEERDRWADAGG
jgi:hypothetical protein